MNVQKKRTTTKFQWIQYTAISSLGAREMVLSISELHLFGYNPLYSLDIPMAMLKMQHRAAKVSKIFRWHDIPEHIDFFKLAQRQKMVGGRIRTIALCKGETEKDYYETTMADVYHHSWLPWLITRSSKFLEALPQWSYLFYASWFLNM